MEMLANSGISLTGRQNAKRKDGIGRWKNIQLNAHKSLDVFVFRGSHNFSSSYSFLPSESHLFQSLESRAATLTIITIGGAGEDLPEKQLFFGSALNQLNSDKSHAIHQYTLYYYLCCLRDLFLSLFFHCLIPFTKFN